MRRIIQKTPVLAFVLCLLMSLLVSTPAQATSDDDSVVTLTDQLKLKQSSSYTQEDISNSWRAIFSDCSNWTSSSGSYGASCPTANDALSTATTHGYGLAVVQRTAKTNFSLGDVYVNTGDKFVTVVFNPESDANAVFRDSYYGRELHATGSSYTYGFNIVLNNSSATPVVSNGQRTTSFSSDFAILDDSDSFNYWSSSVYFSNIPTTYPSGYEGVLIPTQQPPATFAPLGDSFISGFGNGLYEAGTADKCKRSAAAFPRLLQITLDLGPTAFVACSGATTANVLYGGSGEGSWDAPAQVEALSSSTTNVVLSIGGNDVAFSSYGLGCVVECGPGTSLYGAMMDGIEATAFKENLETTYETILEEAPHAEVYVVDYPYMSAADATSCGPFDFSGVRSIQVALNGVISDAVTEVNNSRLHYVPTNYTDSPFTGHHLCTNESGGSYFDITDLHPAPAGHQAYAEVLEDAMS